MDQGTDRIDRSTDQGNGHSDGCSTGHAADQSIDKLRESKDLLKMMIKYRTTCDDKASIIIAVFGVMVSALLMAGGSETMRMIRSLADDLNWMSVMVIIMLAASAALLIIGFCYLIMTVIPASESVGCEEQGKKKLNLKANLYFMSIDPLEYEDFEGRFMKRTPEEYQNDILSEVYLTAKACAKKYHSFKLGVIIGGLGILLLLVAMVAGFMHTV